MASWADKIFRIKNKREFQHFCLEAFRHQYEHITVYKDYCNKLGANPTNIKHHIDIPFLPIEFFKSKELISSKQKAEVTFTSSGTTGSITSKHMVADISIYEQSFIEAFKLFYGNIEDYCILALLPSYLERGGSSLVYMADTLIKLSQHNDSGFYLNNYESLAQKLAKLNKTKQKIILLGVTYALLDMAEQYPMKLQNTVIMETGGMKGKRKDMIREELHTVLCKGFGVKKIHSEYGMTELLSQGYSYGEGVFDTPPWMDILIRDTYDPYSFVDKGHSGGINVIDLANINSCCFIETKDLGKLLPNDYFTILGRFDNSDIRGCNLMVE